MADRPAWKEWQALAAHREEIGGIPLREMFRADPGRFRSFSLEFRGSGGNLLFLDYSKNRITLRTRELLVSLAEAAEIGLWRDRLFRGEPVNTTEHRAALHTALRDFSKGSIAVGGRDIMPGIRRVREAMRVFSGAVRDGAWRGYSGLAITDLVNIGIGGSDLGPRMAAQALGPYAHPRLRMHFVSNADGADIGGVLATVRPETTLFLVASKTFTTQETMLNARTARSWFLERTVGAGDLGRHFVALSGNPAEALRFGLPEENIFEFWDWVGGRYSLWSAAGLALAVSIGWENYAGLLAGASDMDAHFRSAPPQANMPLLLGLIGIWHVNFLGAPTHAVLPYAHLLSLLPAYLQQADMESSGKTVGRTGDPCRHSTGPILWGGAGTNGQHAFFQLLHQGSHLVPCDFIAPLEARGSLPEHHEVLLAHCFAQSEALMTGRTPADAEREGSASHGAIPLPPHRVFEGNRPSNTLLVGRLDPRTLGSLLALYEHKIFVQGVVWGINSFDQWGVELGKTLAGRILRELRSEEPSPGHDSSTRGLINYWKQHRSGGETSRAGFPPGGGTSGTESVS
ncbi:MAG: glucose-6-phosphate isomerase [Bacteroidota bacterium]